MYSLNYQHLKYFWAVARHGNLTRASVELHLMPQTVSSQIKDLETGLGAQLFLRVGRRLVLTETGQMVYRYANEIFNIGRELQETVAGKMGSALHLAVGVADILPKRIAYRLIKPALDMKDPIRVVCREGRTEKLLADLSIHRLDVVLSDAPIPPSVKIRAYNHLLGESKIVFMGNDRFVAECRSGFPDSLNGKPMLLPTEDTVLRWSLDHWFDNRRIRPTVVGEFEDSALLKAFGQAGVGLFAVPQIIQDEVKSRYAVDQIGIADGIVERFYAISLERKIRHPAVATLCQTARSITFS